MAHVSKLTKESIPVYKQLFGMGLPARIIAAAMDIVPKTLEGYQRKLNVTDYEQVKGIRAGQLRMLELYSSWIANPDEFRLLATGTKKDLLFILWKELRLGSLELYLKGILEATQWFNKPTFDNGIPEPEQQFMNTIFLHQFDARRKTIHQTAKEYVHEIMKLLQSGFFPFPTAEQFHDRLECFANWVQPFLRKNKENVAPFITLQVRDHLRQILVHDAPLTSREWAVIEKRFNMQWSDELSEIDSLSPERIKQLYAKAIKKAYFRFEIFADRLGHYPFTLLKAYQDQQQLQQRLSELQIQHHNLTKLSGEQHTRIMFLRSKAVLTSEDRKKLGEDFETDALSNGMSLSLLKTPLEDLDLSIRAFNCLKATKLNFLWELVQQTPGRLLECRNFGKKSLVEIECLLHEKGLSFGIIFSLQEQENLHAACYSK